MAKFILVNGAYYSFYVPLEKFNTAGWDKMLESYRRSIPEGAQNPVVWISLYDDRTGEANDDPYSVREALKAVGKRVDKLSLPLLPGWEEGSLLGEPGEDSGILPQMYEDMEDHAEP